MQSTKSGYRFSLAALMLIVTIAAVVLSVGRRFQAYKVLRGTLEIHAEHIVPHPGLATFSNFLAGKVYRVERLSFQGKREVGDDEIATLAPLKKIRRLSLQQTGISDDVAGTLKRLPSLRVLSVTGTRVTDEFLHQIGELNQLEELYLESTDITDEGVASIAKLHCLRVLALSDTRVSNKGLCEVAKLPNLESLALRLPNTPSHWLAELGSLTNLRSLQIDALDEAGVQELAKLKRLERLQVFGTGYDGSVSELGALRDLKELHMRVSAVKPFQSLPTMSQLEWLVIKSDVGLSIANQPNLRRLDLRVRRLEGDVQVARSPMLDALRIEQESSSGTDIESAIVLADLPNLRKLKVICCSLTVTGGLGKLETLQATKTGPPGAFSAPGAFTLSVQEALPALGEVSVVGYQMDDETESNIRTRSAEQ